MVRSLSCLHGSSVEAIISLTGTEDGVTQNFRPFLRTELSLSLGSLSERFTIHLQVSTGRLEEDEHFVFFLSSRETNFSCCLALTFTNSHSHEASQLAKMLSASLSGIFLAMDCFATSASSVN